MNIVCFGQQNWDVCWVTKQQLLSRLARRGHAVLFVDPQPEGAPPTVAAALRNWRNLCSLRQVQEGLHVLTLRPMPRLRGRLAAYLRRRTVRCAADELGLWAPVALCLWPAQRWLMDAVDPAAKVYFAEDDNAAFSGLSSDFIEHQRREEQKLLRESDLALAVSPTLLERFMAVQPQSYLQENGVDVEQFRPAALEAVEPVAALHHLPRPRLGFVGQIDERLDQDLLVRLAERFPDASIVLTGRVKEGSDISRLRAKKNIVLAGFVDYRQLGGIYRELHVGLVPYVRSPLTESCNPLKIYEYLAADLPTVATDLPGLNSTRDAISIAGTHEAFVAAVEQALGEPEALREQRRRVAESASWQRRADQLEERLQLALSLASERRQRERRAQPRPDRHGRQVVHVEPRLDGKDASVRLLHDDYVYNGLSPQQHGLYLLSRLAGFGYYGLRRVGRLLRGDSTAVRRILVVRNGHLGDTVVFLPTLAALRAHFPKARITVGLAPGSGARPLLEASPYVDEVLALDFFNRSRRDRFAGAARLLTRGFDLVVGGVWYFHLPEAVFSGAPLRLGLYDGHPLQRYADRVMMLDPNLHEAETNLRLVELVTGPVAPELRVPRLKLEEEGLARKASAMRRQLGIDEAAPVVAMHPGSKRPSRRWPAERFAELAQTLLRERPELHVVLTGAGADERELIEEIRAMVDAGVRGRTHDAVGVADLVGVIGFYDTCKLLVCNDTGVMHVARARGVPLVAIIGPENDRRWGPHPLGPAPAVAVRQQVPGTPHGKWDCEWNLSLESIDAMRIKRHVDSLLDGTFQERNNIAPVHAGGQQFFPLVRDVRRLSFAQLLELGLKLPTVAAVLPADPALLGGEGSPLKPDALAAAGRAMRRQLYPAVQALLVTDHPEALAGLEVGQAIVVGVRPNDPDGAWARVLAASNADLIWPADAARQHPPTAISSRVGVFLRGPHATVMDGARAWPPRKLVNADFLSGEWLLTRRSLEDLLVHPLPPAKMPHPDEVDATLEPALA